MQLALFELKAIDVYLFYHRQNKCYYCLINKIRYLTRYFSICNAHHCLWSSRVFCVKCKGKKSHQTKIYLISTLCAIHQFMRLCKIKIDISSKIAKEQCFTCNKVEWKFCLCLQCWIFVSWIGFHSACVSIRIYVGP